MKRLILTIVAMCVPIAAAAQQPDSQVASEGLVLASVVTASAGNNSAVQAPSTAQEPRRRPSMVGYIENASIGSKVRVRFDVGSDIQAADRSEFFYAKCGCYRFLPASHPAYDPDAPGPGPGVLTSADFTQFNVYGEYALSGHFSLVADLPVRSLSPQTFVPDTGSFGESTGIADLRGGLKLGFSGSATNEVTLQALVSAPTGESEKGLGTNHWSVEPALLWSGQYANRFGVEGQFGAVIPMDGSSGVPTSSPDKFSGTVLYYGIGPSVDVYSSGNTHVAPVVEFVGWHVLDGYSTFEGAKAKGTDIVNLKIGGRLAVGANSLYIGWGKALTDAAWYDELIRFEYRYGF